MSVPVPTTPVDVALIGAGNRMQTVYLPLLTSLAPWVRPVAVSDPVRENADKVAAQLGIPAFYALDALVAARPMEAAFVVTPIEGHHAMSVYLSSHGIHNLVETTMASLLVQAQEMAAVAERNGVVMRVAENFFRFPFDRLAAQVIASGAIGPVSRITSLHDHTGYHNNSRWVKLMGYPDTARAVQYTFPTQPHYEAPHRFHTSEKFQARFFEFPGNRLVTDIAGNIKGMLGRYPRPGYTEIDGDRGAIVRWADKPWHGEAEVRICSDEALANGAIADQVFPFVHETDAADGGFWSGDYVDLPGGRVEWVNPFNPRAGLPPDHVYHHRDYYGAAVMDHIADFANAIRGVAESEYSAEDAVMAMMMEVAVRESVLRDGTRVALPLVGDLESEDQVRRQLRQKLGVDPMDVEAVMGFSFARP